MRLRLLSSLAGLVVLGSLPACLAEDSLSSALATLPDCAVCSMILCSVRLNTRNRHY